VLKKFKSVSKIPELNPDINNVEKVARIHLKNLYIKREGKWSFSI
jgi:hypothetical protein